MDDIRYLYEVRPRRPVRIPGKRATLVRQSVQLTKSEVKEYMKAGPVYRKSVTGQLFQVTGENLDKLHRSITEEGIVASESVKRVETTEPQRSNPATQQYNNGQQNQSKKDKKRHDHYNSNNHYNGDERGKSSINTGSPNPQINVENPQENSSALTADIP